ncbi:MAG: hypothetical protein AAB874_05150 [Patescibacteria group bacterium]
MSETHPSIPIKLSRRNFIKISAYAMGLGGLAYAASRRPGTIAAVLGGNESLTDLGASWLEKKFIGKAAQVYQTYNLEFGENPEVKPLDALVSQAVAQYEKDTGNKAYFQFPISRKSSDWYINAVKKSRLVAGLDAAGVGSIYKLSQFDFEHYAHLNSLVLNHQASTKQQKEYEKLIPLKELYEKLYQNAEKLQNEIVFGEDWQQRAIFIAAQEPFPGIDWMCIPGSGFARRLQETLSADGSNFDVSSIYRDATSPDGTYFRLKDLNDTERQLLEAKGSQLLKANLEYFQTKFAVNGELFSAADAVYYFLNKNYGNVYESILDTFITLKAWARNVGTDWKHYPAHIKSDEDSELKVMCDRLLMLKDEYSVYGNYHGLMTPDGQPIMGEYESSRFKHPDVSIMNRISPYHMWTEAALCLAFPSLFVKDIIIARIGVLRESFIDTGNIKAASDLRVARELDGFESYLVRFSKRNNQQKRTQLSRRDFLTSKF